VGDASERTHTHTHKQTNKQTHTQTHPPTHTHMQTSITHPASKVMATETIAKPSAVEAVVAPWNQRQRDNAQMRHVAEARSGPRDKM
jgi:hypothetical protein